MSTEETIKALRLMEHVESIAATYEPGEARSNTTLREPKEACRVAADTLRAQQTGTLGRGRWEGCWVCKDRDNVFSYGGFCPCCGKPRTEAAWAELERRIG